MFVFFICEVLCVSKWKKMDMIKNRSKLFKQKFKFRTVHEMVRCVYSLFYLYNFTSSLQKNRLTENISPCYNNHQLFTVLYSAPSFSYVPLSATELITKVIGDQFQRQHESQKYECSGFLQDIHIYFFCQKEIFPWAQ